MSYSYEKHFLTKSAALADVNGSNDLPMVVRLVLADALRSLTAERKPHPSEISFPTRTIYVKANGHQCDGLGSYERSFCELIVEPRPISG